MSQDKIESGFNAMGKPIPIARRDHALGHLKAMSPNMSSDDAISVIEQMSNHLARDEPYKAVQAGMKRFDLTGTYRLMAALLTDEPS